jgi:hypothetical protein
VPEAGGEIDAARGAGPSPMLDKLPAGDLDRAAAPPPAVAGRPDADDRDWWRDELSLVVESRRRTDDDLDRARRELAEARLESSALRARRSVRWALALSDRLRPLRSSIRPRTKAPKAATSPTKIAPATDTSHPLTPAEFRARLGDRLARPNELKVARVDRADPTRPLPQVGELAGTDVIAISSPDFDVRMLRGDAVSVALVGPDVRPWVEAPWLDEFDIVVTANPASVDAIVASRAKVPVLLADPPAEMLEAVSRWVLARRVGVAVGIPSWDEGAAWGDLHFARGVQRQFERAGYPTRVQIRPEWADVVSARDDVSVQLFGLAGRRRLPGQLTLLWVISHPERVSDELIAGADRIYVASDPFARNVAGRTSLPVAALHQATDPLRFHPDPTGPEHEVLFVGNSRGVRREIVADMVPTTLGLAVYGRWAPELLDPAYHKGELIPNEDLHRYYSSAAIVLNDHWADMRAAGFLSNRLYDALASGACVVSDHVPGIEQEFDGAVVTYSDAGDLRLRLRDLLRDPGERRALAERGRAAVLDRHTFEHRAAVILQDVAADLR